jgi:hypothetical protein
MGDPAPLEDLVVNDRYWLTRAREMVTASIRGRDEAAGRLATAIGWFWTVYTAAALVGVAVADRAFSAWLAAFLALPATLLVFAYAMTVWAMAPIGTTFDPRVPDEIALAHAGASRAKQRRLALATGLTLAAAVAVAAAVTVTATTRPEPSPSLHATRAAGASEILIRGRFTPGQAVTLSVAPKAGKASPVKLLDVAGRDGVVRVTVPAPPADGYEVAAAWDDAAGRWTLTRTVAAGATTTT